MPQIQPASEAFRATLKVDMSAVSYPLTHGTDAAGKGELKCLPPPPVCGLSRLLR